MITAVIITYNEAAHLGRCLDGLALVADEVIVIDAESSDQTRDIASARGARVVTQPWLGYGPQKNLGHALAAHPYILSLDADEALSEELAAAILAVKPRLQGAYQVNRLTNYCGTWVRHSGWYPDRKVRLFPKGLHWDEARVHERLMLPPDLPVTRLQGDLLHYSYHSREEHRQRQLRYARLRAEELHQAGKPARGWQRWLKPAFTWFRCYLLRGGWRDGRAGWDIARIQAWGVWQRYRQLRQMRAKK